MDNRLTALLGVKYPIIQAGMIWCSGWELATAVSNAGGLGLIGAGSMYPDVLTDHIKKCKANTDNPFGVNLPLLYPDIDKHVEVILREKVKIVFTSAGNPKSWTSVLKSEGVAVIHVVSSSVFAQKAEDAGCDAIVAEGFEAGGHNGREETTTLCLLPKVLTAVNIPVIAAGGIYSGKTMLAMMVMGAQGVQIGSRFVASNEASGHGAFKQRVINAGEGDTKLTLKELTPVRLLRNKFFEEIEFAYQRCATANELKTLLGRARAKRGMFEGDVDEGELEIGQVSANIREILPAGDIVREIMEEYNFTLKQCSSPNYLL